jgi:hypothetical protein
MHEYFRLVKALNFFPLVPWLFCYFVFFSNLALKCQRVWINKLGELPATFRSILNLRISKFSTIPFFRGWDGCIYYGWTDGEIGLDTHPVYVHWQIGECPHTHLYLEEKNIKRVVWMKGGVSATLVPKNVWNTFQLFDFPFFLLSSFFLLFSILRSRSTIFPRGDIPPPISPPPPFWMIYCVRMAGDDVPRYRIRETARLTDISSIYYKWE